MRKLCLKNVLKKKTSFKQTDDYQSLKLDWKCIANKIVHGYKNFTFDAKFEWCGA